MVEQDIARLDAWTKGKLGFSFRDVNTKGKKGDKRLDEALRYELISKAFARHVDAHLAGDEMLRQAAEIRREAIRKPNKRRVITEHVVWGALWAAGWAGIFMLDQQLLQHAGQFKDLVANQFPHLTQDVINFTQDPPKALGAIAGGAWSLAKDVGATVLGVALVYEHPFRKIGQRGNFLDVRRAKKLEKKASTLPHSSSLLSEYRLIRKGH